MDVVSGYSGGHVEQPSYQQVSRETTGHQEVVEVRFDPAKLSYRTLRAPTGATLIRSMVRVSSVIAAIPIGR